MHSDGERATLCAHLERTRDLAAAAIAGLSEAQWRFRPSPEAWSAGEIAEHLAISEGVVYTTLVRLLEGPATPERKPEVEGKDQLIVALVPRRRRPAPAPAAMRPDSRYDSPAEAANAFSAGRARTLDFVRTTAADLRSYFEIHPALQLLDAYQWLLLVSAHTERHLAQLAQWGEASDYPHA